MTSLIDKSRTLNRLLQKAAGGPVSFMEMAEVLKQLIHSDTYVISRKGKLLGHCMLDQFHADHIMLQNLRIAPEQNSLLFSVAETIEKAERSAEASVIYEQIRLLFNRKELMIVPVIGGEQRVGTLLLSRDGHTYSEDDVILAEYGATIIAMEILRGHVDESESNARNKAAVQVAVSSLSYSELEAVQHIIDQLDDMEGLLVASKIADKAGITRSVIVNALRKLESAGVIETRSLGMKGTYIKILNERIVNEIVKNNGKANV
jgi:transcriptional pleiotropic repressor